MSLTAARAILAIPKEDDSWPYIVEHAGSFIWSEEYASERWNEIAAQRGLPPVEHRVDGDTAGEEREFHTYKGRTAESPLTHSVDDRLVTLHTLNSLVKQDCEIRFCFDSYHSSDLAFLALAPAEWQALEKEFGADAVAYRFLTFPEALEEFFDQAFSGENNRTYASDEAEPPSPEWEMGEGLAEYAKSVVKPHCAAADAFCSMEFLTRGMKLYIITETDAQRDALLKDVKRLKQILDEAKVRCAEHDMSLRSCTVQSDETVNRDFGGDRMKAGIF